MNRREFLSSSIVASFGCGIALATPDLQQTTSKPFKKIKIAQIGVRHEHASGKINTLKMLSDYFEIVGIAAESPEWEKKYRDQACYQGLAWKSQEELLATPGLEAVAVETEMTELLPTAKRCAELGLHMHVDKPLGQDLDECRELFELCQKKNVILQPGYMFRNNPAIQWGIKLAQSGVLGDICEIRANMNRYDVSPDFRSWLATYRGGGMYDFGSHLVDVVVQALGAPDEIHVFERPTENDQLSDNTATILLYPKTIATLRVLERAVDGFSNRELSIVGTKGSFRLFPIENWSIDPNTGHVPPLNVTYALSEDAPAELFSDLHGENLERKGTHSVKIQPQFDDRYAGQLYNFACYLRGTKKNPYTFDYELLAQRAILAASGYIPWKKD